MVIFYFWYFWYPESWNSKELQSINLYHGISPVKTNRLQELIFRPTIQAKNGWHYKTNNGKGIFLIIFI